MFDDRDKAIEAFVAMQVACADVYYKILYENPLLAKLMMDKLKSFLVDEQFEAIERQSVLIKFLQEHTEMEVVHEILDFIDKCDLKNDYTTIIMEWTFYNDQGIKDFYLSKLDGSSLALNKTYELPEFKQEEANGTQEFIEAILRLTDEYLDNGGDDGATP